MINIATLNKAAVLAALYNRARPQGMGFLHYDPKPVTAEEAANWLAASRDGYFDYIKGRVMKVDLSKDELNEWGFDRDNGQGAAQSAIDEVRKGNVTSEKLEAEHKGSKMAAAFEANMSMQNGTTETRDAEGNVTNINMGLDDVAHILGPAVDRAIHPKDGQNRTKVK